MRPVGVLFVGIIFSLSGCYSPKVNAPDAEEDPFAGSTMDPNSAPVNEAPPPKNATKPDMDFIKDMARRSADQAAQCAVDENSGPRSVATLEITFKPNGHVGDITLHPPHEGTPIGDCIKRAFDGIFVTGWSGSSVKIERKVDFEKKAQEP